VGLPKANRLRKRRDFQTVYAQGLKCHGRSTILRAWPTLTDHPTQVGISLGKKVSKKAVVRNRIKRRIRAAVRQYLPELKPGWKIVFVVKPEAQTCEYEHFLRELKQLLTQAEVWHGH
jgi:ribonuclease P protein component